MLHQARFLALATLMLGAACAIAAEGKPTPATQPAALVTKLSVEEFDKARQEKGTIILDVRSVTEFEHGHVLGAVNIPISGPGAEEFEKRVAGIDRSARICVHCLRGTRSAKAVEKMSAMGFLNLSDFTGGWSAWTQAGKPAEEGRKGGELPAPASKK